MPLIIDANRCGDFSKPISIHAAEVLRRIEANRMRITVGGRLTREHAKTQLRALIAEWSRAGRLQRMSNQRVDAEESAVRGRAIKSDDPHVIALARVSGTRLVYTNDSDLIVDLKNTALVNPKGKIVTPTTPERIACSLFDNYGA